MISAFDAPQGPVPERRHRPGQLDLQVMGQVQQVPPRAPRDSPSTAASSVTVNSSRSAGIRAGPSGAQPGSGRRRIR